jgi:hypothetical protein
MNADSFRFDLPADRPAPPPLNPVELLVAAGRDLARLLPTDPLRLEGLLRRVWEC